MIEVTKNRTPVAPAILFVLCLTFTADGVVAQEDIAPPPSRTVSKEERDRLRVVTDIKDHMKLALEFMNARLATAERHNTQTNFEAAYSELGGFQGLLEDTIAFMLASSNESGRAMDSFKKFEIGIRSFSPRIEAIRRDLPPQYDEYVRSLLKCVRDARSKAVEPLFDDTVVRPKTGI